MAATAAGAPGPRAAAGGRPDAAHARDGPPAAPGPGGAFPDPAARHRFHAAGRHPADGAGGLARRHRRLPARQLAGALRHRAGGGQAQRPDAGTHGAAGDLHLPVCHGPMGSRGQPLPSAVPAHPDGVERRLSRRRPVQSVRLLRNPAHRLLRPHAARLGQAARRGRPALYRGEPDRLLPVADRHRPDLRPDRHAESGGSGPAGAGAAGRRPAALRQRRRDPGHRLPHQGGRLAAQLLAARRLCAGLRTRGRPVRHHDQGGHLRAAAHRLAAAARGRAGGLRRRMDVPRRHRHAGIRHARHAGQHRGQAHCRLRRHHLVRHALRGPGHARRHADGPGLVLPAQLRRRTGCPLHAAGADGTQPGVRRQHAGDHPGSLRLGGRGRPGSVGANGGRTAAGHHGVPRAELLRLRPAHRGAAAAVGLRRRVSLLSAALAPPNTVRPPPTYGCRRRPCCSPDQPA
ncbi:hypothetical protein CDEF62S_04440 [Castellaniella defragrans]